MHTIDSRLVELERRAWRYDTQDGITEFLAGFLFLFVGRAVVDPHLAWIPALLVFPLRFVHRILKERFSYPRIGYVKLRGEDGRSLGRGMLTYLIAVVAVVAIGLWASGGITDASMWKRWLPALTGGFTAGGFLYLAGKSGALRFWFLAAASAGWGVVTALWLEAPGYLGIQRWAVGLGTLCLVVGAGTFVRFLRTHPVRESGKPDERA